VSNKSGAHQVPLFKSSFPDAQIGAFITKLDTKFDTIFREFPDFDLNEFDFQCAACDITRYKWQSNDDIKGTYLPTLRPDEKQISYWQKELSKLPHKISIGISWRSGVTLANRERNYTTLLHWEPILKHPNINLINVQYGDCEEELKELKEKTGIDIYTFDGLDLKDDFEGTIAMMQSLDLVIGAPSAPLMQAQMSGVTAWIVMSGKPWWSFGETNPKWSDNTRILSKNDNDPWPEHISDCAKELKIWLNNQKK
jgi:hypothetical protein